MTAPDTLTPARPPLAAPGDGPTRRRPSGRSATALLAVAIAGLAVWALTLGDAGLTTADAVRAAAGAGEREAVLVVQGWRLPRVLAALLAGAALALAGFLMQAVLRNPLASPDVIGVTMGATTAAVAAIVLGVPPLLLAPSALVGGLAAAAVLVVLAGRHEVGADRLVLVGIGLHTALYAAKTFLIVRFPEDVARSALVWTIGTLYASGWTEVTAAAVALALLVPAALMLLRPLGVLALGDDLAAGLGLRVRAARVAVLCCAVALAAVGVALGGPLPFIALAVPFLARLLTGAPAGAGALLLAALLGAGALLAADMVAEHALPVSVPAGVVTASLGAPVFFWLLWRHHRSGEAR